MNSQQAELYQRIQAFNLDDLGDDLSFSKRLARENGWSAKYSQEAIAEYKKFAFLAVVMETATPSEQVDQVWHLHLTYTHSYWLDFCPHVLQKTLHHNPTKGGSVEGQKYDSCYKNTLLNYQKFFGVTPSEDFWSSPQIRFGKDLQWQKVNTRSHWILPKPQLRWQIPINSRLAVMIVAFALALVIMTSQPVLGAIVSNPFNLNGGEFLWFYAIALAVTGLVGWVLRHGLKYLASQRGNINQVDLNAYEVAYLVAGTKRVVMVAIASLIERGYLELIPKTQKLAVKTPLPSSCPPIEAAVVTLARNTVSIKQIDSSTLVQTSVGVICQRLQQQGLIPVGGQMKWVCLLPSLLMGAVLSLGAIRIAIGIGRGKPVGFLMVLCIIAVVLLLKFLDRPWRTQFGDRYLASLTSRYTSQKNTAIDFSCALFGLGAISGANFIELRQVLSPPHSSGGGGGSSGGDGGCGGGCGGCGGG